MGLKMKRKMATVNNPIALQDGKHFIACIADVTGDDYRDLDSGYG
jgi:hypothetical protein